MKIAFIGFGEAARAFRESLAAADAGLSFATYDILFDEEGMGGATAEAARAAGVEPAASAGSAVGGAEWIVSAVTAASSLEAARSVAGHVGPGQTFIDINSVSPGRKRETAALVEGRGASYVDMAVMAPVHPRGHRTPTLLAGALDEAFLAEIGRLGFSFERTGPEPGAATAIKMVRSLFVKGLEAITVETLLAASASGCLDYILGSLATSYPGLGFPDHANYQFERTLRHGLRRAAEMRESAATVDALGLEGSLGQAIADVQQAMGALPENGLPDGDLRTALDRLVALRRQG